MLKTIIFLSIIVKLAFGEDSIDEDVSEDIKDYELYMTMDVFEALSTCSIDESDELNEIETEMQKRCLQIKKKKACLSATTPLAPGGTILRRKPNNGNDGPGECIYIASKKNIVARKLGNQCVAPAAVKKLLRRLRRNTPPEDEEIMAKNGLLLSANEASQFDTHYIIVAMVIIGLLIGFGAYYKCKGNGKEKAITSTTEERESLYQSV